MSFEMIRHYLGKHPGIIPAAAVVGLILLAMFLILLAMFSGRRRDRPRHYPPRNNPHPFPDTPQKPSHGKEGFANVRFIPVADPDTSKSPSTNEEDPFADVQFVPVDDLPQNATFRCTRCGQTVKHNARTRQAWAAGKRRMFCPECHRQWRREHQQILSRSSRKSPIGWDCLPFLIPVIVAILFLCLGPNGCTR